MQHVVKPSVNLLLVRGKKVLLSRRENKGWMDGFLCIPGGHVEAGESPTIAIIREAEEELGLQLTPEVLHFFCVAARYSPKNEYVAYEFWVDATILKPDNKEPDECSELVWVDVNKLPDDIIPDFREIINEGYLAKLPYLEIGY